MTLSQINIDTTALIGWLGSALAISGALMLAMRVEGSQWGWVFFALSSAALFSWALKEKHHHQILMQGVFLCTNLLGVYRWIILG